MIRGASAPRHLRGAGAFLLVAVFFAPLHAEATSAYVKMNAPRFVEKIQQTYGEMVNLAAVLYDADPNLIMAVIAVESEGNPKAVSRFGAKGLMQLMPKTARALGVKDVKDPLQNILAGTKYLKELEGNYTFTSFEEVLLAYHRGPNGAKRWLSRYDDPEEYAYVANVMYVYDLVGGADASKNFADTAAKKLAGEKEEQGVLAPRPGIVRPRSLSLADPPATIPLNRKNRVESGA